MGEKAVHVEVTEDALGRYETRWMCRPPGFGLNYRVLEDKWSEDGKVRIIRQVEVVA